MSNVPAFIPPKYNVPPTHVDIGDNKYEPHIIPDPAHPYVYHIGNLCAMPHWHENIEILYFHGTGEIICDRKSYVIEDRDIAIVNSNTLHAIPKCECTTHDCLIIDSAFLAKCDINISQIKFEVIVKEQKAPELFDLVMGEITKMRDGDEYGSASVKAAILALMVHLCREHAIADASANARGDTIKRAIAYIKSHYDEPLTVEGIASKTNVSKFYFCREFRRETGYTVVHYINNLRCREAQKLLRSGKHTVSEAARMCGFENLSYFTRTYKAIIGCTPTDSRSGNDSSQTEKFDKFNSYC